MTPRIKPAAPAFLVLIAIFLDHPNQTANQTPNVWLFESFAARLHLHHAVPSCDCHRIPQFAQRMIVPLAKLMDWSAIQAVALMMPAKALNPRLEEAVQFLKGPDFVPTESQPAQVEFNGSLHFRFPTPRPCDFAENNVVHGRLYRRAEQWQERPVIILLPGWNDSASYKLRFPLVARRYNRAGFNVATLVVRRQPFPGKKYY